MAMEIRPDILDDWPEVRSRLPAGFDLEATALSRGAFTRARGVKDAETLLRLALAYGACGMSLRETCAWAEAAEIASLSDPSLLERLAKAAPWLGDVVGALIAERANIPGGRWAGYRLRVLDGTAICRPGADRTTWRLHVGFALATAQTDHLELTDGRGAETLRRLPCGPGDIVWRTAITPGRAICARCSTPARTSSCAPAGTRCASSTRMAAASTCSPRSPPRRRRKAR
jgi:hypothetical protein